MSATINSPRPPSSACPLTFTVNVSYNTTDGVRKTTGDTWWVCAEAVGVAGSKNSVQVVLPPTMGNTNVNVTVPAGTYNIHAWLELHPAAGGLEQVGTDDTQGPISVSDSCGGGIIFSPPPPPLPLPPPPPPPPLAGAVAGAVATGTTPVAKATGAALAAAKSIAATGPVIIQGGITSTAANPLIGMVCEIYQVVPGANKCPDTELMIFISPVTLVGNTFSVVFPPEARLMNRQFRIFLIHPLGVFDAVTGPVT